MPNITIHLDDETHRKAKIYAAQQGTSVSDLFREHIRTLTEGHGNQGLLSRYSRGELRVLDAMDALGFTCVEDLYSATVAAGFELPHCDRVAAGKQAASVAKFLTGARRRA